MPEVREVFDMATQKVRPDPDSIEQQYRDQRLHAARQRAVVFILVGAIVIGGAAFGAIALRADGDSQISPGTSSPIENTSSGSPGTASPSVYERGGTVFAVVGNGSPVALARGLFPVLSPDGAMVAFLRDPPDPRGAVGGDPYVLQAWVVRLDGSGLKKVGQTRGCCVGAVAHLHWSDDSHVVLRGTQHAHTIDVATGEASTMPSETG